MEDNHEKESNGYTGEYGNSVEGDYQDSSQSTYRYSYKDGIGESTHSGDYYANRNTGSGTSGDYNAQTGQNSWSGQSYQNNGQQDYGYQGRDYSANGGNSSQGGYQNNSYSGGSYQNYNSQGGGYQGNGSTSGKNGKHQGNKKKREPASFGMRLLTTAACAVLFGVVSSACFWGITHFTQKASGISDQSAQSDNKESGSLPSSNTTAPPVSSPSASLMKAAENDVSAIAEQCMPTVVAITSTTQGADYYDLFGQYYQGKDTTSCGSGFLVGQNDTELLIATNNHVIDNAKTISVQFIDNEIYEAQKKGADSSNDLAVIAVKVSKVKKSTMDKIKIADLGSSETAKVGEMVIAIGNALGYGQSVTVGYISAKDREISESSANGQSQNKIKALQTDAAINPGNSGGALLNMQGQVVGINSAKIADSSVEGVGYAIPISVAMPIIDELMNREDLKDNEKGYLGITGRTVSNEAIAYNVPYGVYVDEVAKGGAAEKAGIKANDVITAVNKMEVTTMESLQEKINSYRKGTKVEITLQRSNNGKYEEKKVTVTLKGKESLDSLPDDNSSDSSQDNDSGDDGNNGNNGGFGNGNDGDPNDFWDFFR